MTFEDIVTEDMPQTLPFIKIVEKEFMKWEVYKPTTIEADIPFNDHWWKYLYWMPFIKKELYTIAIRSLDMGVALIKFYRKYGMDSWFFERHYKFLLTRMEWMRKNNNANHAGELQ